MSQPVPHKDFTLALIRVARARISLLGIEVEQVGVSLKFDMVTPEGAIAWLNEIGAMEFVDLPRPAPANGECAA